MRAVNCVIPMIIIVSLLGSFMYYDLLPSVMAIHFDAYGNPDSFVPKERAAFFLPIISAVMFVIFALIPKLDKNMAESINMQRRYNQFVSIFLLFLAYLNVAVLSWNLMPLLFNLSKAIVIGFAFLFYFMGLIVENVGQNYAFGIRIPPTVSDERVWNRTHKVAGLLFKTSAVISILSIILFEQAFIIAIVSILASLALSVVYAYYKYTTLRIKGSR
ncbi:MAG: SdpI family protein [Candidatus Micrarchaeota archaeon]|nr:SdpI family protein [Candidatus Micrarchaeota archaeon]